MEQYHVMDVKDFFEEVFVRILFMNADIKIIVQLIKTNVINVDIVDGSMFRTFSFVINYCSYFSIDRKCIRMGMRKDGNIILLSACLTDFILFGI